MATGFIFTQAQSDGRQSTVVLYCAEHNCVCVNASVGRYGSVLSGTVHVYGIHSVVPAGGQESNKL